MKNGKSPTPSAKKKHIVILGCDDAQILDVTGPAEILQSAAELNGKNAYQVTLVGPRRDFISTTCGINLSVDRSFKQFTPEEIRNIDTLVVAGGRGMRRDAANVDLMRFVGKTAKTARRVTSVCTGAFILAAAGLLDGRRAATHWMYCDALKRNFPGIDVDQDAIYVRDGKVWTSAGVTAGMDLALALVEEDLGREVALEVARQKVMFMMRPGGQSQYSSHLAAQQSQDTPIGRLMKWILENVSDNLSVPELARQIAMSERNFARQFAKETGTTPARFVEAARVEAARRSLEEGCLHIDQISMECGFSNAERMRRAFHRHLGISPQDYRARFGKTIGRTLTHIGVSS